MTRDKLLWPALLIALWMGSESAALAIPAFANKYEVSCSACHAPAPRLRESGREFAARGFRLADPEQEPPDATRDFGDPLLALPRDFPLSVRIDGFAAWDDSAAAETDTEFPYVFKIISGGPLSPKISYYLYFIVEQGEVEGLEDAYLQFNSLFGSKIDMVFGQFQVSDPLFKRELRLERLDYEIYRTRVGLARANLTYDRGVALGTALGGVDVVLEVVNGNGIPEGEFDNDNHKNLALRLAREFGRVRLGLFGYAGKEDGGNDRTNAVSYFGPDLSARLGSRGELNLQYLERRDDDPFFTGRRGSDLVTEGGFAEAHFFPQGENGRWVVSALYNRVRSDDPAARRESAALTLNRLLARNIRLVAEVGRDLEEDRNQASIGVSAAF
ncbi:MAG: hypothetical protein OES32_16555 [Acidobacteriota bacterium]|nr:hypothetical protein [Acidobacteriota bacterium]MDH3525190.1 hypothetical protein [Acidobacteriota bacterium]